MMEYAIKKDITMPEKDSLPETSTYFADAENAAEMARLMMLAAEITEDMGGHFPPQVDPNELRDVLDIACGPGQWVQDVAKSYPQIQATGGDISHLMIAYASALVKDLPNAHFLNMDAQQPLPFPDQSFDFVQARLITAFMLTSSWPVLLRECQRILRPGGTLCLIEAENIGTSTSVALERYNELLTHAMRLAGHAFAPAGNMTGITVALPRLLDQGDFEHITQRAFALNYSFGMKAHPASYSVNKTGMKLIQPFLIQHKVTTQAQIEFLYERALKDMQAPDFCAQLFYLAVSGRKPA